MFHDKVLRYTHRQRSIAKFRLRSCHQTLGVRGDIWHPQRVSGGIKLGNDCPTRLDNPLIAKQITASPSWSWHDECDNFHESWLSSMLVSVLWCCELNSFNLFFALLTIPPQNICWTKTNMLQQYLLVYLPNVLHAGFRLGAELQSSNSNKFMNCSTFNPNLDRVCFFDVVASHVLRREDLI